MMKSIETKESCPTLKTEGSSTAYDKIIMNYHNQNSQGAFPFTHPQFPPWSQGPYHLPPMPSPHFPPYSHTPPLNLLIQQQNNYFNSNFSNHVQPLLDNGHFNSMPSFPYHTNWMPRPEVSKQPVKEMMVKKKPEVICLD